MIKKKQPEKVWTDKRSEFKGDFKKFCEKKGIHLYTTESETKSAFAERNIRSLKNNLQISLNNHLQIFGRKVDLDIY